MLDGFRVFDAHLHVQPWEQFREPVRRLVVDGLGERRDAVARAMASLEGLLAFLDAEGVDRAVLVNYVAPDVTGTDERVNPWVGAFAKAAPDRLVAMGGLHPARLADPAAARAAVDALVDDHGVRAFKLHPSHQLVDPSSYRHDERLAAIYARLAERGVPMTVHTGTSVFPGARTRLADPLLLDDVAIDFPKLTILVAHAGRPFWHPQAEFLARRHPNVHLELSGIPPAKLLDALPKLPDLAEKALFGSDWPGPGVKSVAGNARALLALPMPSEAKAKILWDNAARVFGAQ